MSKVLGAPIRGMDGSVMEDMEGMYCGIPRLAVSADEEGHDEDGHLIPMATSWNSAQAPRSTSKMLTFLSAVSIQLTPLEPGEVENHRVIKLNSVKRVVHVGRASKNVHKGLLTGRDNAYFDYPILSRSHATFSVSTRHLVSLKLHLML